MRVLYAPKIINNRSVVLARALKERGIDAVTLQYYSKEFKKYPADIDINIGRNHWYEFFKPFYLKLKNFPRFLNFDVYHFNYNRTLLFCFLDIPILKLLGKKIVFEYHGSEIRPPSFLHKYFNFSTKLFILLRQLVSKLIVKIFVDEVLVTTPDLLDYVSSAKFIPVVVEESWLSWGGGKNDKAGKIIIAHAPTNRVIKGTDYIVAAVDQLKKEDLPVELDLIEGVFPSKVRERLGRADIVIDQVLLGWYGMVAVQAMALSKPVVCYIRDDLRKYAPGLPIVSATTINLTGVLRKLVVDSKIREELGRQGSTFVRKFHSSEVIAKRMIEIYKNL